MKTTAEIIEWCGDNSNTDGHSLIISLLKYCGVQGTKYIDDIDEKANEFYEKKNKEFGGEDNERK